METKEVSFCKGLLFRLGRCEKTSVIEKSNLNNREQSALKLRYVGGETVKATASRLGMETDAYNKMQKKALVKLYNWLEQKAELSGTTLDSLM